MASGKQKDMQHLLKLWLAQVKSRVWLLSRCHKPNTPALHPPKTYVSPLGSPTQGLGAEFERRAEQFLLSQGLTLVMRNYWCKLGEIDLIMRHKHTLVFVEVRYRRHDYFGGASASVTPAKQQKLRRAALCYLQAQGLYEAQQPCRFDLVAYEGLELHWLENAF